MRNPAVRPPSGAESGEAMWAREMKRSFVGWQTTLANVLFSLPSIVLWSWGDSATASTGREFIRDHPSWRDNLFKVLQLVHQEGGNEAQIKLDMRSFSHFSSLFMFQTVFCNLL